MAAIGSASRTGIRRDSSPLESQLGSTNTVIELLFIGKTSTNNRVDKRKCGRHKSEPLITDRFQTATCYQRCRIPTASGVIKTLREGRIPVFEIVQDNCFPFLTLAH